MTDDDHNGGTLPPPELPDAYIIPRAAVDEWLSIAPEAYVDAQITRHDWDKLFESYENGLKAQYEFQEAMVAYTNGDTASANEKYHRSRKMLIDSQNAFRQMFTSLILSAAKNK